MNPLGRVAFSDKPQLEKLEDLVPEAFKFANKKPPKKMGWQQPIITWTKSPDILNKPKD